MIVGTIAALFRYPVKSMAGEAMPEAPVGWYGIDGDRRFAVRRVGEPSGMPWLTASKLPELLRFKPVCEGTAATHVRTPEGQVHAIGSAELAAEISRRHGKPVEVMRLDHGIFDETPISVITSGTVDGLGAACGGIELGVRRFRPNIFVHTTDAPHLFEEDAWVGRTLSFGDGDDAVRIAITQRDLRCAMANLDPDTTASNPLVMKTIAKLGGNYAGVYATVLVGGRLAVGQRVHLR